MRETKRKCHKQMSLAYLHFAEIEPYDWMLQVRWLILTNQSTLFLCKIVFLCWDLLITSAYHKFTLKILRTEIWSRPCKDFTE